MRRKTAILLVLGLVAAYVGSYLFYSRDGRYFPIAWGTGVTPEGITVIRSKRLGKVWQPFSLKFADHREVRIRKVVYLPLILLDRWVWHRDQPETEDSVPLDYY